MLLDRQDAGIDQIELVEVIPFYGDIDFWRQPESPLVTVQPVLVTAPGVQKAGDIGKELLAELFDLEIRDSKLGLEIAKTDAGVLWVP